MYEDTKHHDFVVIAVAEESRGAESAAQWITEAEPSFPCLIDCNHHVADLFNMVNVPQAVWIDEHGKIVRPAETAGSHDGWRSMDRADMSMSDEVVDLMARAQTTYLDAVRDWAANGASSRHVLSDADARAQLKLPTAAIALANANFRLGSYLRQHGNELEGDQFLHLATELRPDSWNIYRQAMNLREPGPMGLSADEDFFARVDALGHDRYYPPPNIDGFPSELGFEPPGNG